MKLRDTLGGCRSIDGYVKKKLSMLDSGPCSFASLYRLMFSEAENIMFEESRGYRIKTLTYGQCRDETERIAPVICRELAGIMPGAAVGIYMKNSPRWIEIFWALLGSGYRPVLLNLLQPHEVTEKCIADSGCLAVIAEDARFSVHTVDAANITPCDGKAVLENFGSEIMMVSSGTGGSPKICIYTPENIYAQIRDSAKIVAGCPLMKRHYNGSLKLLTFLPFYHIFGFVAVYVWFAFYARTFVLLNDMTSETVVNTIRRHGVTHIFAVPLFWEKVYNEAMREISARDAGIRKKFEKGMAIARKTGDIPVVGSAFSHIAFRQVREGLFGESISFLISGGGCIKPEILEFFNSIGYRLANGYGMTEIGITSVELSAKRSALVSGSVGVPLTSAEYRINDGELSVKGSSGAAFVIEGGVRTRRESGSFYPTGDLAEYADGCYYIRGRSDDLIIAENGENINPELIEPMFELPDIRNRCLITDKINGKTRPLLILSVRKHLTDEAFAGLSAAVRRIADGAGLAGCGILFVTDTLMGDSEFKVNRKRIAKLYSDGKLNAYAAQKPSGIPEDSETVKKIRDCFAAALGREASEIALNADFFSDFGGTSLDYFELCQAMSAVFGTDIRPGSGETPKTVSEFYALIDSQK